MDVVEAVVVIVVVVAIVVVVVVVLPLQGGHVRAAPRHRAENNRAH